MKHLARTLFALATLLAPSLALAAPVQGIRTTGGGVPLRWRAEHLDVALDASLLDVAAEGRDTARAGLLAWQGSAGLPAVSFHEVAGASVGFGGDADCTVVYRPEGDAAAGSALAITVTTYDQDTGLIYDADVIVNGAPGRSFAVIDTKAAAAETTGPTGLALFPVTTAASAFDLQSVLTHEGGHFYGLADMPNDLNATMYPLTSAGQTHKRELSAFDRDALSSLYADNEGAPKDQAECGASIVGRPARGAAPLFAAALLGVAVVAYRRRAMSRYANVAALGAALVFAAPATAARGKGQRPHADADARVSGVRVAHEGAYLRSEVTLTDLRCHAGACPALPRTQWVWGGREGRLVQAFDGKAPPSLGERVEIELAGAVSALDLVSPRRLR